MPNKPLTPIEQQLLRVKAQLAQEMPDMADVPLRGLGWLGSIKKQQAARGGTELSGVYNPLTGAIELNEDMMNRFPDETMSTAVHEGKHAAQAKQVGLLRTLFGGQPRKQKSRTGEDLYGRNSDELEAFQAEKDYRSKRGMTPLVGQPNFDPEEIPALERTLWDRLVGNRYRQSYNERGDILLPRGK